MSIVETRQRIVETELLKYIGGVRDSASATHTRFDSRASSDTVLGIHVIDLPTAHLTAGTRMVFTFHWAENDRWETENFLVTVYESNQEIGI